MPLLLTLGLGLLALGWLAPGHYLPWLSFMQQYVAAFGAMLIALDLVVGDRRADRVRWPWLACLAAVLAVVPWLQWVAGKVIFLVDALLPSLYLAGFALAFVTGAALNESRGAAWRYALCMTLVLGATLAQCIAVLQWLQLSDTSIFFVVMRPEDRPGGNLAQANHHATLLALGIAGALSGHETRAMSRPMVALVCAWLGAGLVITQSRTAWLFLALLAGWWMFMRRRAALRLTGRELSVAIGLFILALVAWKPLNDALLLSADGLADVASRAGGRVRLAIWEVVWDAVTHAPWTGFGWNQVGIAQLRFGADHPRVGEMALNSHNTLLDLFMWGGIPLGLLVALAVVAWFVREVRACNDGDRWGLLLACAAIWLHAQLEYPLDYLYFLLPLGLLMGTLDSGHHAARVVTPKVVLAAPLSVAAALMIWIGVEYVRVEEATRNVRLLLIGVGTDRVPHVPPPDVVLIDGPREFHRFMITPAREGMSAGELAWMRAVVERYPVPPAMLRYAVAAGINGQSDEAAAVMRALCPMHNEARCTEGRASWSEARQQFPALAAIPGP
jgi:O-antigen ligase